jgi:hypothetical protein
MTKEGRGILKDEARLIVDVLPDTRGIVRADVIGRVQENLPSHADVGEYALYLFGGHQVNN